ncbi:serine/threonine protein kinase [Coleofasciculus sp.]|uniref:serine/threonine protein kinase n=1 Tax=Coleofasciculus sp. TaxID=3100458 RepID=UPI003A3E1C4A
MKTKVLKERYAIQKQLAKNAGRRTFLARDLQTQELVVIKLLIFGENFQWDDLKLFQREAQTLQLLSHPAIPHYLDYFDVDTSLGKGFALVQSYIPAKSLNKWLKSGRTFSEEDVKELAKALLGILRYLHGQQPPVIHRDIKPSNILLANRTGNKIGEVYLVDLGAVQTLAAKKGSTITVVGTYGYMPPEQFGGRTVPASDLYSLGATLIYLVTGRHPAELPQENLRIQFESSVNLSPDLIDWLKWMTQPSLNRRMASAGEALKVLEQPRQKTDKSAVSQKPFGSRIKVKKYSANVDILIPPKSIFNVQFFTCILMMFICVIISIIPLVFLFSGYIIGVVLGAINVLFFSLPFGSVAVKMAYVVGVYLFRSTRLHLDHQKISLTYEWLWWKRQQAPIMKNTISQLHYTYLSPFGSYPRITILAGQRKYEVSTASEGLVEPEMNWLAHELSEWSGVPITVKNVPQQTERLVKHLATNRKRSRK